MMTGNDVIEMMNKSLLSLNDFHKINGLSSSAQNHYQCLAMYQRLIEMHNILLQQQTNPDRSQSSMIQQLLTEIKIMNDNNQRNEQRQNEIIELLKKNNELIRGLPS